MGHYIILPRYLFTSLYKYGEINVDADKMIWSDFPEDQLVKKSTEIFKNLPYFEYDDEYILLGTTIDKSQSSSTNLKIDQIDEVIAFSDQAKISIESKIDKRIKIEVTGWSRDILRNMEEYYQINIIEKGIDALWRISGFEGDWRNEDFLPPDLLRDLVFGIKERASVKSIDKQQKNLLIQAIVYDRTNFFPNGNDGYLFDIFEILCNHLAKGYSFTNTELFPLLMDQHSQGDPNCWILYKNDTTNVKLKNIKSALTKALPSDKLRWENSLAWFFAQKTDIQNKGFFDLKQFRIDLDKKYDDFVIERKMAVILLGAFFGYKYFYDALYDEMSLKFFKRASMGPKEPISKKPSVQLELLGLKSDAHNKDISEVLSDDLATEELQEGNVMEKALIHIALINPKGEATTEIYSDEEKPRVVELDVNNERIISNENNENDGEDSLIPLEEIPTIEDKIIQVLKNNVVKPEVIYWVIECYKNWEQQDIKNQDKLLNILWTATGKPNGFGKGKATSIIEMLSKDNLI